MIKKMSPLLLVADIENSIQFYTAQLGFVVEFLYEDFYSGLVKDNCSIHLKSGKPSGEERRYRRNSQDPDIVFSVDDIEHIYGQLSKGAVQIIQPLRDMPYGREFYISDPDGYIIAYIKEV